MQPTVKARKSAWSAVKTSKRAGQSFDLEVAAVTIESMRVTPPCSVIGGVFQNLRIIHNKVAKNWNYFNSDCAVLQQIDIWLEVSALDVVCV